MTWYWINFVDPFANDGHGMFLGIVITYGHTALDAVKIIKNINVDPNVIMAFMPVPSKLGPPPDGYTDRLLTFDEASTLSLLWTKTELVTGFGEALN